MKLKWTFEAIQKEALKYKTRSEFETSSSAYQAATKRKILDNVCQHMDFIYNYSTCEELQQEALKYKTRNEFQRKNIAMYTKAIKRKILDKICIHMKYGCYPWTCEELQQEASKYKTRHEFRKNNTKAYNAALRRKILDEICQHMDYAYEYRTDEELLKIAKKYIKLSEFRKNEDAAFQSAYKRGTLKSICSHMRRSSGSSLLEQELFDLIKIIYPNIYKYIDRKVNIADKPWIKRFEIDIFESELKKGVEFDGKYWHSFIGLKRSHPKWSNKDIENYHQIKDDYFISKGIQILHIKEEDWIKDSKQSLSKALDFLSKR